MARTGLDMLRDFVELVEEFDPKDKRSIGRWHLQMESLHREVVRYLEAIDGPSGEVRH
jgi:hypothetical protein